MSDSTEVPRVSPTRSFLGGCALLLALVLGAGLLAVWLVRELTQEDGVDSGPPPATGPEEGAGSDDRGRLTRTERRALETELVSVERDLAFARDQARMAQADTERAAWRARAAELAARRDEIRTRLGR